MQRRQRKIITNKEILAFVHGDVGSAKRGTNPWTWGCENVETYQLKTSMCVSTCWRQGQCHMSSRKKSAHPCTIAMEHPQNYPPQLTVVLLFKPNWRYIPGPRLSTRGPSMATSSPVLLQSPTFLTCSGHWFWIIFGSHPVVWVWKNAVCWETIHKYHRFVLKIRHL